MRLKSVQPFGFPILYVNLAPSAVNKILYKTSVGLALCCIVFNNLAC